MNRKYYTFGAIKTINHPRKNPIGVLQDYVNTHKWFILAAANGSEDAAKGRAIVAKLMTSDQIAEAQKMARLWLEKHERG